VGSVVIVGGGIAGLTCAWRLAQAGHAVEVLEREARSGGRVQTGARGGFRFEHGAQFLSRGYSNVHLLLEALGLGQEVQSLHHLRLGILREGRLQPWALEDVTGLLRQHALISIGAKLSMPRLFFELLRQRHRLDPLRPELAAVLDVGDAALSLRGGGAREVIDVLFAPAFFSCFHAAPVGLSDAFVLLALRAFLAGICLQAVAGGLGVLVQSLAAVVPVRTGCEVVAVETETDGARVRYRTGEHERHVIADAVVVATPGNAVWQLCPKLTPSERAFFGQLQYRNGIMVHLLLERAPAVVPYAAVVFPQREGLDLLGLSVGHHRPEATPPGQGLVSATLGDAAAERLWEAKDAAVVECVLENLSRTALGRLQPVDVVVQRWSPLRPHFGAGHLRCLSVFHSRSDVSPRLAFAGDYFVSPNLEGAVISGMRAANEVAAHLGC